MRVLHVLHNSLPLLCGYSIRSAAIVRHQRQQGIEPIVVTSARQPNPSAEAVGRIDGVDHFRTPPTNGVDLPILRERGLMRALQRRVEEVIQKTRPDLVHAHSPVLVGLPALRAARDHGLPFVYEVRDLWENASVDRGKFGTKSPFYQLARRVETDVLRGADAVVTICEALRSELAPRAADPARVFVVGNGVDVERFQPPSTRAAADPTRDRWRLAGKEVIAYVGTFQPYEGLDVQVRAMPQIVAARPNTHLLIVGGAAGENHDVEHALRALVDRLGMTMHVTLTGRLPHAEVASIYALADVVVYPRVLTRTTALTTPLKPLEAMAMACAVIGSDVPAMTEIIRDGETGMICRAGQPDSLARVCLQLLADPTLRRALGDRARAWTVRERQWTNLVARYRDIYEPLVESTSFPEPQPDLVPVANHDALSA